MKQNENEHKNLKAERVKKIFAETAKKMIIQEGIESVSVRKVAEQAGYTFATLYNHFKNIDELLWYTRNIMIGDIIKYMESDPVNITNGIENVQNIFRRYLGYFIKNPNVFRFFYFHHLKREDKPDGCNTNIPGGKQALEAFGFLTASGHFTQEEAGTLIQTMIFSAHGLLTLSISDNDNLGLPEIPEQMDKVIQFLLRELQ